MALDDLDYAEPRPNDPIGRGPCGKKVYSSVKTARWACHKTGSRLRTYWCDECGGYHVTNGEKR